MVITVALRPEDISLSILQGYIEADTLWQRVTRPTTTPIFDDTGLRHGKPGPGPFGDGPVDPFFEPVTTYITLYEPASSVHLVVSLSARNPSGRADIICHNITVRVVDMPGAAGGGAPYNFTGMVELQTFHLPDRFTVERQSSHTVRTVLTLNSTDALIYIAAYYGGKSSFQAMVQVNATVSSSSASTAVEKPLDNTISHYCWPVTVASYVPTFAGGEVACKSSQEMGFTVPPAPPASA